MAGSSFAASLNLGTAFPAVSRANQEFGLLALRQKWTAGCGVKGSSTSLQHFGLWLPHARTLLAPVRSLSESVL